MSFFLNGKPCFPKKDIMKKSDFSNRSLTSMPDGLFSQPETITELDLKGNRLSSLPEEFGTLVNLEVLDLSSNQLAALPDSFRKLAKLRKLNLYSNELPAIPGVLENLKALENLNIRANRLESLPEWMGQLPHLRILDVSNNNIDSIPRQLCLDLEKWGKISRLRLESNPIEKKIPKGILELEAMDIVRTILEFEKGTLKYFEEIKVVVLGGGRVGKTSLIHSLTNYSGGMEPAPDELAAGERGTRGIDIYDWRIRVGPRTIKVNFWDFGGQRIQHDIHRFFLSEETIYLVVTTPRSADHSQGVEGAEYWFRHLKHLQGEDHKSPVFLVFHQADDPKDEELIGDELERLKNLGYQFEGHAFTSIFRENSIKRFGNTLEDIILKLRDKEKAVPESWIKVRDRLASVKDPYMRYQSFKEIVDGEEGKKADDAMARRLLERLHNLGVVVKFDPDGSFDRILVFDPNWVVKPIYEIILSETARKNKGVVNARRIWEDEILQGLKYPYNEADTGLILNLMETYHLCFPLGGGEKQSYLIPALLETKRPEASFPDEENALRFRYNYNYDNNKDLTDFIDSVIFRFIAKYHHKIKEENGVPLRWRHGVVLKHLGEGNELVPCEAEVVRSDNKREINIRVFGPVGLRHRQLDLLRHMIAEIHDELIKEKVQGEIPIGRPPNEKWIPYFDLDSLLKQGQKEIRLLGLPQTINVEEVLAPYLGGDVQPAEDQHLVWLLRNVTQTSPEHSSKIIEGLLSIMEGYQFITHPGELISGIRQNREEALREFTLLMKEALKRNKQKVAEFVQKHSSPDRQSGGNYIERLGNQFKGGNSGKADFRVISKEQLKQLGFSPALSVLAPESQGVSKPLIIVEELSPLTDLGRHLQACADAGVDYYVGLSPEKQWVQVHKKNSDGRFGPRETDVKDYVFDLNGHKVTIDFREIWG